MADYDWFDNQERNLYKAEAAEYEKIGFRVVFRYDGLFNIKGIKYFRCLRGCGTIVWNPEEHMKNVCIGWEK